MIILAIIYYPIALYITFVAGYKYGVKPTLKYYEHFVSRYSRWRQSNFTYHFKRWTFALLAGIIIWVLVGGILLSLGTILLK